MSEESSNGAEQSAAFLSHCRRSLDSSWTRTHPGSILYNATWVTSSMRSN